MTGLITDDEYARLTGRLTELWMKYNGKGTNSDIMRDLANMDDLSIEARVYGGFIHGIEVMRNKQLEEADDTTDDTTD